MQKGLFAGVKPNNEVINAGPLGESFSSCVEMLIKSDLHCNLQIPSCQKNELLVLVVCHHELNVLWDFGVLVEKIIRNYQNCHPNFPEPLTFYEQLK